MKLFLISLFLMIAANGYGKNTLIYLIGPLNPPSETNSGKIFIPFHTNAPVVNYTPTYFPRTWYEWECHTNDDGSIIYTNQGLQGGCVVFLTCLGFIFVLMLIWLWTILTGPHLDIKN